MLQSRDQKLLPCPPRPLMMDRRWKTTVEVAPNCPRCNSSNTKFCYYNNYSLTQPRYFCKGCRRYWTKGGSLRNVPVGGGCRKNRRGKSIARVSNNSDHINNIHARSSPVAYARGGGAVLDSDSTGSFSQSSGGDVVGGGGSSSSSADASTIDLAVVYAKFLNHQPAPAAAPAGAQQTEYDGGAAASFELSSSNGSSNHPGHHSPVQFSSDHSIMECSFDDHLREYNPPQFSSELVDANINTTDIPALPQRESLVNYGGGGGGGGGCFGVEDTLWSSCCLMEPNFAVPDDHHPQGLESMIELDHHDLPLQPSFHLNGNSWSTSFDYLSSCDAFGTRP